MKPTTKLRRAPRKKEGETDKSFQARLKAYERDKAIREYERNSPQGIIDLDDEDAIVTPEQAAIIARMEKDKMLLSLQEPEWEAEKEAFLEKHHAEHQSERRAAIVAAPTGTREPSPGKVDTDPLLSRLDEILDRVGGLERHVDKLSRLVAATMPARTLKPAAKAAVLELAPELAEAFKDERVRELYETYEHVVKMGRDKKITANFPKSLWGELVEAGIDQTEIVCRVIPHSALIARCAAKKVFRVMEDEESSVENVRFTLAKSGLVVTTMHAAGLKRGSQVKVVMDHTEAVMRGLVKGLEPVPELPKPEPEPQPAPVPVAKPQSRFDKAAWADADLPDEEHEPELPPRPRLFPERVVGVQKTPPGTRVVIEDEPEDDAPTMSMIGLSKPHPDAIKRGNPRFAEWEEPEPITTDAVDDEPTRVDVVDEPGWGLKPTTFIERTTTPPVEDEIDTEPWEEEDEQPDEDFALFRTPEEPQKSSRAVDLFAD